MADIPYSMTRVGLPSNPDQKALTGSSPIPRRRYKHSCCSLT